MIYVFNDNGEAIYQSSGDTDRPEEFVQEAIARAIANTGGVQGLSTAEVIPAQHAYLRDGKVCRRDARPSDDHVWDKRTFAWVDPRTAKQKADAQWGEVKAQRDKLLDESDWVVLRAYDLDAPVPGPWRVYRQRLRDITNQQDPFNITWPDPPKP